MPSLMWLFRVNWSSFIFGVYLCATRGILVVVRDQSGGNYANPTCRLLEEGNRYNVRPKIIMTENHNGDFEMCADSPI